MPDTGASQLPQAISVISVTVSGLGSKCIELNRKRAEGR